MMNILYISVSQFPSIEANSIQVMKMCQAFQQEGHETILAFPFNPNWNSTVEDLWVHYGIQTPFSVRMIDNRRWPVQSLKYWGFSYEIIKMVRKESVDLVYGRNLHGTLMASLFNIPTIYELHSPIHGGRFGNFYFNLLLRSKGLKKLVVITNALKNILTSKSNCQLIEKLSQVEPDAVDFERFEHLLDPETAKVHLGISPDQFVIGYAGNLYKGRGIETILQLARESREDCFLIVGGKNGDLLHYHDLVIEIGLSNVKLTGFKPSNLLPIYLSACDVLLMPFEKKVYTVGGINSSAWMSPMKMFEYMASGRMIVTSDLPILREILDPSTAAFCTSDNITEWANVLRKAKQDKEWREQFGRNARNAVQKYTWRNRVRRILSDLDK